MKMNFGKRLVLFLHWLLSLIACAFAVGLFVWPKLVSDFLNLLASWMGVGMVTIIGIALLSIYVFLMVLTVAFIFSKDKKRGDRGFITVDSSESGRTRIAVGAVEQMIRQAVRCVDGIADMKVGIVHNEDAVSINTSVAIASGAHVPTVTMNIQRAIRSYIELNCGVAVREVSVSVHSLESEEGNGKQGRRKASAVQSVPAAPAYKAMPAESESVSEPVKDDEIRIGTDYSGEAAPAQDDEIAVAAEKDGEASE